MAARIESHVTVLYEVTDVAAVGRVAGVTAPLRLRATRATLWEGPDPGIYLGVDDPHGDLARFRDRVGQRDAGYRPHITLLHRDSVATRAQAEAAWAELRTLAPEADFDVALLVVYEEADGAWSEAARMRFGA